MLKLITFISRPEIEDNQNHYPCFRPFFMIGFSLVFLLILVGDLHRTFYDFIFPNFDSFYDSNNIFFPGILILYPNSKGSASIVDWESFFAWTGVLVPGLWPIEALGLTINDLFIDFFIVCRGCYSKTLTSVFLISIFSTSVWTSSIRVNDALYFLSILCYVSSLFKVRSFELIWYWLEIC